MTALDFPTRRFQSAAAHYLVGRVPYPEALISNVARLLELRSKDRILDLGCGPGQLATAFAPFVAEVLAIDPEPNMLALAREAARDLPNVKVAEGSSDDLGPEFGRFRTVLIGRAFHWMDREETLRRLDQLIEPDGAVVLFGDSRPAIPENKWVREVEALLDRYVEDDEDRRRRRSGAFLPHISVLLRSPFNRLEQFGVTVERELTIDGLVERALSRSSTSRARLGERADDMIEELRALAAELSSSGPLVEVVTSNALIARRQ